MTNLNHKYYRLIAVTDREGKDKSNSNDLYSERIGCIGRNIHYDFDNRVFVDFIEDADGKPILRGLHTSVVEDLTETEEKLTITTMNTVYTLEAAELAPAVYLEETNLIELYLSERSHHFVKGVYYDEKGTPHNLDVLLHLGMLTDTALVSFEEPDLQGENFVCRYYVRHGSNIEFYDTLYHQQEYKTPMLIHNVGDVPLCISFEMFDAQWTIAPRESERITPPNRNN